MFTGWGTTPFLTTNTGFIIDILTIPFGLYITIINKNIIILTDYILFGVELFFFFLHAANPEEQ